MMQYDLTNTPLARADEPVCPPNEAELVSILVALMIVENCSYFETAQRQLVLTPRNRRAVADIVERRLAPLARDWGGRRRLRVRLRELVGLRIHSA